MPDTFTAPSLTGTTIDRADQIRSQPEKLSALMTHRARLLRLDGLDPQFGADGLLSWGTLADARDDSDFVFLGLDADTPRFAEIVVGSGGDSGPGNPRLWQALMALPGDQLALYGAARSVVGWHARHRFCANCGHATTAGKGGWARYCGKDKGGCGAEHFPRVDPVAIMLAEHDGKVLLGRQPRFPHRRFSALAGFIEPGESIEEGVARELHEEAGIKVRDVRYVASQPWPFPSSLMIACTSVTDDPALTLDPAEIEDAAWFDEAGVRAAMNGEPDAPFIAPPPFAIAYNLLEHWLNTRA